MNKDSATLEMSSSAIVDEIQRIEEQLDSMTAPSANVSALRSQLGAKQSALQAAVAIEAQANAEDQHQQDALTLKRLDDDVRQADAMVQALRAELSSMQKRLMLAEVAFNDALRVRGVAMKDLGKGN